MYYSNHRFNEDINDLSPNMEGIDYSSNSVVYNLDRNEEIYDNLNNIPRLAGCSITARSIERVGMKRNFHNRQDIFQHSSRRTRIPPHIAPPVSSNIRSNIYPDYSYGENITQQYKLPLTSIAFKDNLYNSKQVTGKATLDMFNLDDKIFPMKRKFKLENNESLQGQIDINRSRSISKTNKTKRRKRTNSSTANSVEHNSKSPNNTQQCKEPSKIFSKRSSRPSLGLLVQGSIRNVLPQKASLGNDLNLSVWNREHNAQLYKSARSWWVSYPTTSQIYGPILQNYYVPGSDLRDIAIAPTSSLIPHLYSRHSSMQGNRVSVPRFENPQSPRLSDRRVCCRGDSDDSNKNRSRKNRRKKRRSGTPAAPPLPVFFTRNYVMDLESCGCSGSLFWDTRPWPITSEKPSSEWPNLLNNSLNLPCSTPNVRESFQYDHKKERSILSPELFINNNNENLMRSNTPIDSLHRITTPPTAEPSSKSYSTKYESFDLITDNQVNGIMISNRKYSNDTNLKNILDDYSNQIGIDFMSCKASQATSMEKENTNSMLQDNKHDISKYNEEKTNSVQCNLSSNYFNHLINNSNALNSNNQLSQYKRKMGYLDIKGIVSPRSLATPLDTQKILSACSTTDQTFTRSYESGRDLNDINTSFIANRFNESKNKQTTITTISRNSSLDLNSKNYQNNDSNRDHVNNIGSISTSENKVESNFQNSYAEILSQESSLISKNIDCSGTFLSPLENTITETHEILKRDYDDSIPQSLYTSPLNCSHKFDSNVVSKNKNNYRRAYSQVPCAIVAPATDNPRLLQGVRILPSAERPAGVHLRFTRGTLLSAFGLRLPRREELPLLCGATINSPSTKEGKVRQTAETQFQDIFTAHEYSFTDIHAGVSHAPSSKGTLPSAATEEQLARAGLVSTSLHKSLTNGDELWKADFESDHRLGSELITSLKAIVDTSKEKKSRVVKRSTRSSGKLKLPTLERLRNLRRCLAVLERAGVSFYDFPCATAGVALSSIGTRAHLERKKLGLPRLLQVTSLVAEMEGTDTKRKYHSECRSPNKRNLQELFTEFRITSNNGEAPMKTRVPRWEGIVRWCARRNQVVRDLLAIGGGMWPRSTHITVLHSIENTMPNQVAKESSPVTKDLPAPLSHFPVFDPPLLSHYSPMATALTTLLDIHKADDEVIDIYIKVSPPPLSSGPWCKYNSGCIYLRSNSKADSLNISAVCNRIQSRNSLKKPLIVRPVPTNLPTCCKAVILSSTRLYSHSIHSLKNYVPRWIRSSLKPEITVSDAIYGVWNKGKITPSLLGLLRSFQRMNSEIDFIESHCKERTRKRRIALSKLRLLRYHHNKENSNSTIDVDYSLNENNKGKDNNGSKDLFLESTKGKSGAMAKRKQNKKKSDRLVKSKRMSTLKKINNSESSLVNGNEQRPKKRSVSENNQVHVDRRKGPKPRLTEKNKADGSHKLTKSSSLKLKEEKVNKVKKNTSDSIKRQQQTQNCNHDKKNSYIDRKTNVTVDQGFGDCYRQLCDNDVHFRSMSKSIISYKGNYNLDNCVPLNGELESSLLESNELVISSMKPPVCSLKNISGHTF